MFSVSERVRAKARAELVCMSEEAGRAANGGNYQRLLERTADFGKNSAGVRTNESHCAQDDYENDSKHDCIFSHVLASFI